MTVAPLQLPVWKDVPQLNFAPLDQVGNALMMRGIINGISGAPDPMQGGVQPQQGSSLATLGQPQTASAPAAAFGSITPEQTAMLTAAAQKYGIDPNYLLTAAKIEGTTQNPNSSAQGLGQFIDSTAKQYGVVRGDDASAADGFARFTVDNKAALTKALGRDPTPGELYLAHQQGAQGAINLLTHPNAPAVSVVGQDAVVNNGGSPLQTAGDFASRWTKQFGGAGPGPTTLAYNGDNPPLSSSAQPQTASLSSQPGGASAQPSQAPQQVAQAQPAQAGGPATIAQPWMTPAAANRYESAAQSMYSRATAAAMLNPAMSAAMRARGDAYMKQAEIIRQSLAKNSETTPEMKNAVDPNVTAFEQRKAAITTAAKNAETTPEMKNAAASGVPNPIAFEQQKAAINTAAKNAESTPDMKNAAAAGAGNPLAFDAQKKIQDQNITAGQKRYEGIQAQSSQYERDLKPYLDVSRSILNDPRMYSGIGGELSLDINRVKAALGDKNAAVMQEALQKVTASSVLGQINNQRAQLEEAGGNSSRIFSQQVDLVEKAAPALANTTAGNRFLVEVASRMGDLSSHVAQMAREYKQQHGTLDTGFDQHLSSYMKQNPIFTPQEMSNPALLGAPTVPPTFANDPLSYAKWAGAMGIKSGDPIRLPNGKVKPAPSLGPNGVVQ